MYTYLFNSYQKAKAKQLKAWCHVSVTPGFGRQKGRKIPGSKPACATQAVKQNKLKQRYTQVSLIKLFFSLCVDHQCVKGPLQANAAGSSRAALPLATYTYTSFKPKTKTLWEWFDGGYHSKQKAIPDPITKCGPVIRVLLHVPW